MISENEVTGAVEAALDEWFAGSSPLFDEPVHGVRRHRVERLSNGVWRTYPVDDPNAKRHWDITVLVREIKE